MRHPGNDISYPEDQPGICLIALVGGGHAVIDEEDLCRVDSYRWRRIEARETSYDLSYAVASTSRREAGRVIYTSVPMHRVLMGLGPGDSRIQVDHKNHDGLDNRRSNLRFATPRQNTTNTRKKAGSTSNYRGVVRISRTGRWMARLEVMSPARMGFCLGTYDLEAEAAFAYRCGAARLSDADFVARDTPDEILVPDAARRDEIERVVALKIRAVLDGRKNKLDATSQYRGVSRHALLGKWSAKLKIDGKTYQAGLYRDEHEAALAVNFLAKALGIADFRDNDPRPGAMPAADRCDSIGAAVASRAEGYLAARDFRNLRLVSAFGETKALRAWGRDPRCRVSRRSFGKRLDQGWEAERAMSTAASRAPAVRGRPIVAFGESMSLMAWTRDLRCKVKTSTLSERLRRGWEAEKAIATPVDQGQ